MQVDETGLTPEQIAAAKAAKNAWQREYQREYRRKHPGKDRAAQMRYWARKAAEMNAKGAKT